MDPDVWGLAWLIAAALFLGGEVVLPGFILLPFGISAALASLVSFLGAPVWIGWMVFLVGGLIGFLIFWKFARGSLEHLPMPKGVGADRLVGSTGTVIQPIAGGATGSGFVQIGAEQWRAESSDHRPIAAGVEVEIVEVKGTRVLVRIAAAEGFTT